MIKTFRNPEFTVLDILLFATVIMELYVYRKENTIQLAEAGTLDMSLDYLSLLVQEQL